MENLRKLEFKNKFLNIINKVSTFPTDKLKFAC